MGYPYNPDRLINLEIKKKSGSCINPDIHHSKVPSSDQMRLLGMVLLPYFKYKMTIIQDGFTIFN